MLHKLKKELVTCASNLLLCSRFLLFKSVDRQRLINTTDQIVLMTLVYGLLLFISTYFISLPRPEFNLYGISSLVIMLGFVVIAVFTVSKLLGDEAIRLELINITMAINVWFYLLWLAMGQTQNFSVFLMYGDMRTLYIFYNIVYLAVLIGVLVRLSEVKLAVMVKGVVSFSLLLFVPLHYLQMGGFWYEAFPTHEEIMKPNINQEEVYYKQFGYLNDLDEQVLPERPGITDLYFVGFGSYASEDVFMKEVDYAKELFDDRFDTRGRSIGLINNHKTIDTNPIASRSNLEKVLEKIGRKMNIEEDVLFLYLTSHGSKTHHLSIELRPLMLNTITPQDLKKSLDNSAIKWRVLLVSACYSGGFVDALKNDDTLVMTASAADRTSFGCGSKSEFTYFGKAIFDEQLRQDFNFIRAFENAVTSIQAREIKEKQELSKPQLYIGDRIRIKLESLSFDLSEFDRKKNLK